MRFHPFEISAPHIIYAALGGFVVIFGMFSLFIREKLYIGEAIWAFLFGIIIGPYGANIFDPRGWGNGSHEVTNAVTLELTRVVLAIGVFAIGVELPKAYMRKHWKSLAYLLAPIMTWGWFVSGALIYALIPGLNFLSSLAIAACLTPTDPILAAAVIGGKYADKHVPAHLRHLLAAESGCNDGAAFPFLFIAIYLINDSTTGQAISDWFLLLWLYQVIMGIVFGALLGIAFRYLMRFCERKDLIDRQSYVAQYVSLAMLTIGTCTLLGTDDLLAAFACGTAFAWDGFFNKQTEESVFSSVIDLLFNIAAFIFVGAWMPFDDFSNEELGLSVWRLVVIALLVLLLRRLPVVIALYKWIPDIKTFREAVFSGHFGPMGIGAIFIATLASEQLPHPHEPPEGQRELLAASIQPIVAFMVLCSILIHGLSIPFFSLGRRVHSVSRTWSRHDTFGGGRTMSRRTASRAPVPEWAAQVRHVQPGEDIVINRDAADLAEKGESITPVGSIEKGEKGEHTSDGHAQGDMREENAPDGQFTTAEWREGPHKIIERRGEPGEEVEVEVQKNAFTSDETISHTMRVAGNAAHNIVRDLRHKLQHAPEEVEHTAAAVAQEVQREASDVGDKVKELEEKAANKLSPTPSPTVVLSPPNKPAQDEEDEGWMSDKSAGSSGGGSKARGKSPKSKHGKSKAAGSSSRRRPSFRKHILGGRPQSTHRSQSEDLSATWRAPGPIEESSSGSGTHTPTEDPRGRTGPLRPSAGHLRINSVRTLDSHSRDMSPARSVRFVNPGGGERSGHATPRFTSTPGTPQPGSEAVSEDEHEKDDDSPRIRFSLPSAPPP